jgi:hypothetical protein
MAMIDQDFEMYQGDTKQLIVSVVDGDGVAVDLTGAIITWKLYKSIAGDVPDVVKTLGEGANVTDALNGEFIVELAEADTLNMVGQYYHEAQVQDIRGYKTTVMTGKVVINKKHA